VIADLMRAIDFAMVKHHGQLRSGTNRPYIVHPLAVARIVSAYTQDLVVLRAAILHDVIEDTDTKPSELEELFGSKVTSVVMELTDDHRLSKKEQREHLFAHAHEKSWEARMVKIADGISNVSDTGPGAPEGWSRSLKLAYVKTCAKVTEACVRGGDIPPLLHQKMLDEVHAARIRLAK